MEKQCVHVLCVEDDEDDYIFVRRLLSDVSTTRYRMDWIDHYDNALPAMLSDTYDLCLLDYRLGAHDGLQLLQLANGRGCKTPVVLLTEHGEYEVDVRAMKAGAADFLVKSQITTPLLDRSIRYAIERRRSEEALRASEERFRFIAENTGDVLYRLRYDSMHYDYLSPAVQRLTGYSPEEVQELGFSSLVTRIDFPGKENVPRKLLVQNRQEGKTGEFQADYLIRTKTGEMRWLRDHSIPWLDATSRLIGSVGILCDMTERKQTEAQLKEKNEILESIFGNIHFLVAYLDRQFRFIRVNRAFSACYEQFSPEHFVGKNHFEIYPDRELEQIFLRTVETGEPYFAYEKPFRRNDGPACGAMYWDWSLHPVKDEQGEVNGLILCLVDRTASARAKEQLRFLSSRLLHVQEEERTRLAHDLHDSIGQTLAAIKFSIENALHATGRTRAKTMAQLMESLIPIVQDAIEHVRRVYMDLRTTLLDDFGVIAAMGCLLREFARSHPAVEIRRDFSIEETEIPQPLKIVIFRVVQEALNNTFVHSSANLIDVAFHKEDDSLRLAIKDNGVGFDLEKALSSENRRRGLGLTSMKERIEISGGTFSVASRVGQGTTIQASWPALSPRG